MDSRFSLNSSSGSEQSPPMARTAGIKRRSSDADGDDCQQPLATNKLGNLQEQRGRVAVNKKQKSADQNIMDTLMKQLQDSEVAKSAKSTTNVHEPVPLYRHPHAHEKLSSSGLAPSTPASNHGAGSFDSSSSASASQDDPTDELSKLKRQLAARDQQLAAMQQELDQTRTIVSSIPRALEAPTAVHQHGGDLQRDVSNGTISKLQEALNAQTRPVFIGRHGVWDNVEVETPDAPSTAMGMIPGQSMWTNNGSSAHPASESMPAPSSMMSNLAGFPTKSTGDASSAHLSYPTTSMAYAGSTMAAPLLHRQTAAPLPIETSRNLTGYGTIGQPTPLTSGNMAVLQHQPPSRPDSAIGQPFMAYNAFSMGSPSLTASRSGLSPPITPMPFGNGTNMLPNSYIPRPIGTRPSPPGSEYNAGMSGPWNNQSSIDGSEPTYIPPVEPLNYRRLLARNASCNWDYIVDKIINNNDQQASIFLQQKLKQATAEHRHQIIQSIISKAYPVMVNRFGNFLVQRCFEHGTPEQVVALANAICGNTLQLSMDQFGCHVIQKAFDAVPEEYKAMMVHELLRQIPQTVCHRYSCHVWQKLFELRWSDSPPQIMKYVNEALSGMWHSVALGETGSLVVQNIFENCLDEDKRPCIDECLNNIDEISRGQFGNWCIQHICEFGAPRDRNWAIDHILRKAQEYSTDQYASKVVEKCLKIGGDDFMDRYLDRVCEARTDRPRQAIIDIAGDQYGNYLIQWILANASPRHREVVSMHVRKHMVSLRGSKYGSRVAMLCSNPQSATRPGAPADFQLNRYNTQNSSNGNMTVGMGNSRTQYPGAYR